MYVKYEISFSWMLTSARFDFSKVHKRTIKGNEQGHVLLSSTALVNQQFVEPLKT